MPAPGFWEGDKDPVATQTQRAQRLAGGLPRTAGTLLDTNRLVLLLLELLIRGGMLKPFPTCQCQRSTFLPSGEPQPVKIISFRQFTALWTRLEAYHVPQGHPKVDFLPLWPNPTLGATTEKLLSNLPHTLTEQMTNQLLSS